MGRRKSRRGARDRSHEAPKSTGGADLSAARVVGTNQGQSPPAPARLPSSIAEREIGVSVSTPGFSRGPAAQLRSRWWFLAAVICVVAVAGSAWVSNLCRNGSPGQAALEAEAQESRADPKSDKPVPAAALDEQPDTGPVPGPPVAPPRGAQGVPHAKPEEKPASKPVPPQADRQAAVKAEIDALEKESIEIAQTLIQDFPGKTDPLGLLGMVYNRCDRTAKALECWERALNRNPNRPDLYDTMAMVLLRKGEYEKAAELCRKGLEKSCADTTPSLPTGGSIERLRPC